MHKLLLINTNLEKSPYTVPPLGLCMLANTLLQRYDVRIYDGVFDEGKSLVAMIKDYNPDFLGFSIRNIDDVVKDRTVFYPDGIMEKFIRPARQATRSPVILGGSGFSIFPREVMEFTGADFGIVGEAEILLPMLLDRLAEGKTTSDLPNLIAAGSSEIQSGAPEVRIPACTGSSSNLDQWIDFAPYRAKGVYSVQTKRGCAHGCVYCTYPVLEGKKFRIRPPAEIAEEIARAHDRLGDVMFEFVDSTFNDPKGHAEAVCREIIRKGIKVRLRTMGINPRHSSEELFDLMLRAGFVQIDATPDSASPGVLEKLAKGFRLDEIVKMAGLIRKFNIPTMWFFLFGGPGESEETVMETFDFIKHHISSEDLVYLNSGIRIYPDTPLYRVAVREGKILAGQSVFSPPVYYEPDHISRERIDLHISDLARETHNCIPSSESSPPPEMLAEAMKIRKELNLTEPMFRTLLRIRAEWRKVGKM